MEGFISSELLAQSCPLCAYLRFYMSLCLCVSFLCVFVACNLPAPERSDHRAWNMYIRCQDPLYYSTLRCYMQTCHANRRICCKRKSAFPSLRSMKPAVTFNLLVLLLLLNRNSLGSYRNFQSSHMMSTFFIVIVMIKECLLLISDQLKCIKKRRLLF